MFDLSLIPELEQRLKAITCEDYAPLIVCQAKTMADAEIIVNWIEIGYYKGGLNTLVKLGEGELECQK